MWGIVGKNGFEHNKLAIFELKLQWVPQSFFGGSILGMCSPPRGDENYILSCSKPLRSELEIASKHHSLKMVTKGFSLWKSSHIGWEQDF